MAEIKAAIERLSSAELNQLRAWLELRRQQMLAPSAKPSTRGDFSDSRNGVPLLHSRGEVVTPEKICIMMELESI